MTALRRGPLWGFALLVTIWIGCGGAAPSAEDDTTADDTRTSGQTINLYFPGEGGLLYPDPRDLTLTGSPEERVRRVLDALLEGPRQESLQAIFSRPTEVVGVYLTDSGLAYIDLAPAGVTAKAEATQEGDGPVETPEVETWTPEAGSLQEIQMAYSLVNSVVLNVPEVTRVVPLWMGEQSMTFAGHLDTSRPLAAAPDLIARPKADADPQA
ncbi:MAG: GerMN domain-containing protein [Acidobacteriota bacterium]